MCIFYSCAGSVFFRLFILRLAAVTAVYGWHDIAWRVSKILDARSQNRSRIRHDQEMEGKNMLGIYKMKESKLIIHQPYSSVLIEFKMILWFVWLVLRRFWTRDN